MHAPAYKALCVYLDATKGRALELRPELEWTETGMWRLVVRRMDRDEPMAEYTATDLDQCARGVARKLTLDGGLPPGLA